MATKFSQFTPAGTADEIVGYTGTANIRIPGAAITSTAVPAKAIVKEDDGLFTVYDGEKSAIVSTTGNPDTAIAAGLALLTPGRAHSERLMLIGSYNITTAITLEDYTTLDLTGAALYPQSGATGNACVNNSLKDGPVGTNNKFINVVGGYMDGTAMTGAGGSGTHCGVFFRNVQDYSVSNIHSYFARSHGIQVEYGDRGQIQNNRLEDYGDDGVSIHWSIDNVQIVGNACSGGRSADGGSSQGIEIENETGGTDDFPLYMVVARNKCWDNPGSGILNKAESGKLATFKYCVFSENQCWGNGEDGIRLVGVTTSEPTNRIYLQGNLCHSNTSYGVRLWRTENISIMGGVIANHTAQGVYLDNAIHTHISGGIIVSENGRDGIDIKEDSTDTIIDDAHIIDNNRDNIGGDFVYSIKNAGQYTSIKSNCVCVDTRATAIVAGISVLTTGTNCVIDGVTFDGTKGATGTNNGGVYLAQGPVDGTIVKNLVFRGLLPAPQITENHGELTITSGTPFPHGLDFASGTDRAKIANSVTEFSIVSKTSDKVISATVDETDITPAIQGGGTADIFWTLKAQEWYV